ncbi:protein farnesyltransferase/geranylgeranyltransferase type-1 subunit alpha [Strigomonas culicis]|nr:protein farnesyltransferase/geranylgeranyltransferase type-1 subunit alpha [Strigomonas culicis]|eukprot:EPY28502.1 protein farnesyltransferase/geranylgeranyltransferase type-1 subunit alpha [Strigomonas culicis]
MSEASGAPEENQLYLLTNVDLLKETYLTDVTPLPEPNVERFPVMPIGFTASFDTVYGAYRALRGDMNQLLATSTRGSRAAPAPPGALARWLLVLAFALRQCMSHFTAWHDRRDLVLRPLALQHATREELRRLPSVPIAATQNEDQRALLQQIVTSWLPSTEDLELPSNIPCAEGAVSGSLAEAGQDGAAPCRVSLWRAVRWELRTTQCIGLLYHKNFQVWHHRKDLLSRALSTLPADVRAAVAASEAACNDYFERHHAVSFTDLDERLITARVFTEWDAKNYHVWLHRAWFINAFPFLVEGPRWAEWCAAQAASPQQQQGAASDFHAAPADSLPACPLKSEVDFTGSLIEQDWWNNSAWCHRHNLFEQHVAAAWLQQRRAGTLTAWQVRAAAHAVLRAEVDFALRWAVHEVSNECPLTYSLSMATLYQRVLLWLHCQEGACDAAAEAAPLTVVSRAAPWGGLQSRLPVVHFLRGFALLFYMLRMLRAEVFPVAEGYRDTLYDTLSLVDRRDHPFVVQLRDAQTQYGIDNLHQVHAALYHGCFEFLQVCWVNYFDEETKASIHARRAPEVYATEGVSDALLDGAALGQTLHALGAGAPPEEKEVEAWGQEELCSLFLLVEASALATAKQLIVEDEVRIKYWKREITTVLFREYN